VAAIVEVFIRIGL